MKKLSAKYYFEIPKLQQLHLLDPQKDFLIYFLLPQNHYQLPTLKIHLNYLIIFAVIQQALNTHHLHNHYFYHTQNFYIFHNHLHQDYNQYLSHLYLQFLYHQNNVLVQAIILFHLILFYVHQNHKQLP